MEDYTNKYIKSCAKEGDEMVNRIDYEWDYAVTRVKGRYLHFEKPTRFESFLIDILEDKPMRYDEFAKSLGLNLGKVFERNLLDEIMEYYALLLVKRNGSVELNSEYIKMIKERQVPRLDECSFRIFEDITTEYDGNCSSVFEDIFDDEVTKEQREFEFSGLEELRDFVEVQAPMYHCPSKNRFLKSYEEESVKTQVYKRKVQIGIFRNKESGKFYTVVYDCAKKEQNKVLSEALTNNRCVLRQIAKSKG